MIYRKITKNFKGNEIVFKQDQKGFFWLDLEYFVALTEGLYDHHTIVGWIKEHKQFANNFYSYHNMEPGCRGLTLSFNEYGIIASLLCLDTIDLSDAASWVVSTLQSLRFTNSLAGPTLQHAITKTIQGKSINFFFDQQNKIWTSLNDICKLVDVDTDSVYSYHVVNPDDYSLYLQENVYGNSFNDCCGVNEYGIIAMPILLETFNEGISSVIQLTKILKTYRLEVSRL